MTTSLQRHLLLKLSKAQTLGEKGFTLIELLVVIIIIGILAAVALPSLLAQTDKARASEAKSSIGTINRAQEGYYLENSTFASNSTQLGTGGTSSNFAFTMTPGNATVTITAAGVTGSPAAGINCTSGIGAPAAAGGAFTVANPVCVKGNNTF